MIVSLVINVVRETIQMFKMDKTKKVVIKKFAISVAILAAIVGGILLLNHAGKESDNHNSVPTQTAINEKDEATDEPFIAPDASQYLNNKTLTSKDNNGNVFSLGVTTSDFEGLVFNPHYSTTDSGSRVGYYTVDKFESRLVYSQEEYVDLNNADFNSAVDWTYDKIRNTDYMTDTDFGVCWKLDFDDPSFMTDYVKFVAVDLDNRHILGSFTAEITKNDNIYEISNLYNNDITEMPTARVEYLWDLRKETQQGPNGEWMSFTEEDRGVVRQALLDKTRAIIETGQFITTSENLTELTNIVELTDMVYHQKILTAEHTVEYTGNVYYPVYAVTINSRLSNIGHFTFYFIKQNFEFVGCDFFYLDDEATLRSYGG